ncbi:NADH-quinone oxidoreductase subunit E [Pseudaestuariivita sp.]|uniref:NADH-quinone oxidoreductase subunit E n=1 Tax=Pseudaestuariivita sp. TaxID=2211669 RepID=UPI004058D787
MLRRLHQDQPETFAFTPDNQKWAEAQIKKYPEGREASAIIPLLWRAQEQEGWLSRPAIEHVSEMLGLAFIRGLEVASFYFMFQLKPTGSVAHVQICGTTSCMICGAEDLVAVCKDKIAPQPFTLSADGKFTWEEVECLGACANAPMAQIGKDYYEDLTADGFAAMLDALAKGDVPTPGPQNGRWASEPASGLTTLTEFKSDAHASNASVTLATDIGDTVKRIDGTEVPYLAPWVTHGVDAANTGDAPRSEAPAQPTPKDELDAVAENTPGGASAEGAPVDATGVDKRQATEMSAAKPPSKRNPDSADIGEKPATLEAAREGVPDNLKKIKGVGPKLEALLHRLGFYHFDQVAGWTDAEVAWVDANLEGFKGRVSRDDWVAQAKILASGGETEFSSRVK